VFGGCDSILHVLSLATGKKEKEIDGGAYIAGSVAVVDHHAYYGHYGNDVLRVDLRSGEPRWTFRDRNFPYFSSPAVSADRVVIGGRDRRLHGLDRETGERAWVFATRGRIDSSPVIVGDKVVVGSDDGRLYMVTLADGRELWSYEIGQALSGSPAVADGRVVIGSTDGNVYAFGPTDR
jgi:outer membrane protein assembly factor BamB